MLATTAVALKISIQEFAAKHNFSNREVETIKMIIIDDCFTAKKLSDSMEISENTARIHCKNIFRKVDVISKTQLLLEFLKFHSDRIQLRVS